MKMVRWVNFYPPTDSNGPSWWATTSWKTEEFAHMNATPGRLACVRVEFKEGDGLPGPWVDLEEIRREANQWEGGGLPSTRRLANMLKGCADEIERLRGKT